MRIFCSSILLLFTVTTSYLCCLNIEGVLLKFFFGIIPPILSFVAIALAHFNPSKAGFYDIFMLCVGFIYATFMIFVFHAITNRISNEKINSLVEINK
jgi:hypothetical protein